MGLQLTHGYHRANGISIHAVEAGSGTPIVLCHGFPELWYSWRHQIPVLADAGFRVIAPDMRGSGETSAPPATADYGQREVCADLVGLLDALEIEQAIFVGHDWGGVACWSLALHYPERVRAVGGISAPAIPASFDFLAAFQHVPGIWDYQFYFLEPGVAEAELEADVRRFFDLIVRSSHPLDEFDILYDFHSVRRRGGLLVGYPEGVRRTIMRTEEEQRFFVEQFEKTGFRGALNWYRVHRANHEWNKSVVGRRIQQPSFVVTAGRDPVVTQDLTIGMETWIPNLTRHHIEKSSHWIQEEHPAILNDLLLSWLLENRLC